ncbi:MAG: TM2 domain-containing protein [Flavobacteriaceae bacterium]|nr:TM2 domain-containing protein [Flavobacteriaceae bacterium]
MSEENNDFAQEAKETVNEFAEGAKDLVGQDNKKVLAGVLAIIFGGFGVHKFILGYNKEGVILLICTFILGWISCGMVNIVVLVITVVEGIIYLTKSDKAFYNTYQVGRKPWF